MDHRWRRPWPVLAAVLAAGCATAPRGGDDAARDQMLELLMPRRIEIVEPFTRLTSFDLDDTPDGVELLVQAVNALDCRGIMLAGRVRVELFQFVPASADPKGTRLEHWEIELSTPEQQEAHWNSLTQMYELRLGINPAKIPRADKYVLMVTYVSPLGDRLSDEYTIGQAPGAAGSGFLRRARR